MAQKREINQRSNTRRDKKAKRGELSWGVLMVWALYGFDGTGRNVKRLVNMPGVPTTTTGDCCPMFDQFDGHHGAFTRALPHYNFKLPSGIHTYIYRTWLGLSLLFFRTSPFRRIAIRIADTLVRHICSPACENWLLLFIAAGYGQSF